MASVTKGKRGKAHRGQHSETSLPNIEEEISIPSSLSEWWPSGPKTDSLRTQWVDAPSPVWVTLNKAAGIWKRIQVAGTLQTASSSVKDTARGCRSLKSRQRATFR